MHPSVIFSLTIRVCILLSLLFIKMPNVVVEANIDSSNPDPPDFDKQVEMNPFGILSPEQINAEYTVGAGCDYPTIQAAIAAASSNDTLLIEGGVTFTENLVILNKSLNLIGGSEKCGSGSSEPTVIDGNSAGSVIDINGTAQVLLENFVITNGSSSNGGGIWVGNGTILHGNNLNIHGNTASSYGGGVRAFGSTIVLTDTIINSNTAQYGGGIAGTKPLAPVPTLTLAGDIGISGNEALSGDGYGGALYLSEGTATFSGCAEIESNQAEYGGAMHILTSTVTLGGSCSSLHDNTAAYDGGGIYAHGSVVNLDNDFSLYGNEAGFGIATGNGGGIHLDGSYLYGDKISIASNTSDNNGGGIYAANASLVSMDLGGYLCSHSRCSVINGNTAGAEGGAIYSDWSSVDLEQTTVVDNESLDAPAIEAANSAISLENVMVTNNVTTPGLMIIDLYNSDLIGSEVTIARVQGAISDWAIDTGGTSTVNLSRSIVWEYDIDPGYTVTCSDIEGGYTGTGNINQDPLFVDPENGNFHLRGDSPAIDRCTGGPTLDIENDPRPVTYYHGTFTPYDMGADEAGFRVGINDSGCIYGSIQAAVAASNPGDTVIAAADIYMETVDISQSLTVEGGYDTDCTTPTTGTTTIDGSAGSGSVFDITGGSVILRHLGITGGQDHTGGGLFVENITHVTLDDTNIYNNTGDHGGGVYIQVSAALTMTNGSSIYSNVATVVGGGLVVSGDFYGEGNDTEIYDNQAPEAGGISITGFGELVLNGSAIFGNRATSATGRGGGIFADIGAKVTLTNSVQIGGLNQAYDGAGIYATNATIDMYTSRFVRNFAVNRGGGLYLRNNSTLNAFGSDIGHRFTSNANTAQQGAGIYAEDSTIIFEVGGKIFNNLAERNGAGIYADNCYLQLSNVQIGSEIEGESNRLSDDSAYGAGMFLTNNTQASIDNTRVFSNSFLGIDTTYGGGAYIGGGSTVTFTNSSIEGHNATLASEGRGAGLYIVDSSVILDNSQVLSNTAGLAGGGVRIYGDSSFIVKNGSLFRNNHAVNYNGGAIYGSSSPEITIENATFRNNSAGEDGGGIHIDSGNLSFTGWMQMTENQAGQNGGAIAVEGTGDLQFDITSNDRLSYLELNHASGHGGAIYVQDDDYVPIWAVMNYPLEFNGNTSSGNGGALYATGDVSLDVRGRLSARDNTALPSGYGGFAYIGNGAVLTLNGWSSDLELLRNQAAAGGAVYATNNASFLCDDVQIGVPGNGNTASSFDGGAVLLGNSSMVARDCRFQSNSAAIYGGAVAAYESSVDIGAANSTCDPLSSYCSLLDGNAAGADPSSPGYGGAIYIFDSTLSVKQTYINNNSAKRGGGIYIAGSETHANIENVLMNGNSTSELYGSAIRASQNAYITATHLTLVNNTGAAAMTIVSNASAWIYNNIIWGNTSGFSGSYIDATCNIDQSGIAGTNVDPDFVGSDDFHLLSTSPAIDACITGLGVDIENVTRPIGSGYDMGAYEVTYTFVFVPVVMRSE